MFYVLSINTHSHMKLRKHQNKQQNQSKVALFLYFTCTFFLIAVLPGKFVRTCLSLVRSMALTLPSGTGNKTKNYTHGLCLGLVFFVSLNIGEREREKRKGE